MSGTAPEVAVAYVSITPSLKGFQTDLKRQILPPVERTGREAGESFSGKMGTALKGGMLAVGAAVAAGAKEALDQANITSTLQAQLGATSKDAARYGKVAGKLFSKGVTDDFQQGADAIKSIMQAGIAPPAATNAQLADIATKATDLVNVFGQDLPAVTNAVSQMMKTGLARNSGEAFDIITKGLQSGVDKGGDFLETINEYGTQFRKAGLDGATGVGLLNQAIKAGARDSDVAADAIKEFSIRAVDGSALSAQGFKALGLSGKSMSAQFAKGGKSATAVLDVTLDRLRGIKDPVKQAAAATALFGTQSEDLGKALFAMDPSKAAAGLGKVGGAAKQVGDTIRSGPAYQFKTFTRSLQQGFVTVLGGYVVPALTTLITVIGVVAKAGVSAFGWVRDAMPVLAPFIVLIAGLTLAVQAQAIGVALLNGVMAVWRVGQAIGAVVTGGFTAAQAALNAVMALNPFVLVAVVLAALVVGIVIAYKRSETFRKIVQAAWSGIQTAASYAWNNVLKPIFTAYAAIVVWVYNTIVKPIFGLIMVVFRVWWTGVKLYVGFVISIFKTWASLVGWVYRSVVKPVFGLIAAVFRVWWAGVKVIFGFVSAGTRAIAAVFKWLYSNAVKPYFNAIGTVISTVYNRRVKPVFSAFKTLIGSLGGAFRVAVGAIKSAWDKVGAIAKKPVSFIIDTVYNKGIVKVWNLVAGAFGAPKLNTMKFARGGILPGYTPGRDPHKFYSATGGALELSGGEAFMRPEFTRAVGAGGIKTLNDAARTGGVSGVRAALGGGTQAFKDGGIFNWIGNALQGAGSAAWDKVKDGASWLASGLESSARAGMKRVVDPLLDRMPGSSSLFGQAIRGVPAKMMDAIFRFGKTADTKMAASGIGGKGTVDALNFAKHENGKPYIWGGVGPAGYDCSGFMSAIQNVIMGKSPHSRQWATGAFSGNNAPGGWVRGMKAPFMVGITNAGVGHTAGTLNGVNVESSGGRGVHLGSGARGYRDGLFPDWYGFAPSKKFDNGGWLQPGATMAINKTGKPERILTDGQWDAVSKGNGGLQPGDRLVLVTGAGTEFEAYIDRRADNRIDDGLTGPASLGRS